jgi:hypothetical protein
MPTVNISRENNDKIIKFIENDAYFTNVESFVNYVLSEVLCDEKKPDLNVEEQAIIHGRLKALGYL